MKTYEVLEHTGDVKIKVYGRTKEELFENGMRGMMVILKSKVNLRAEDIGSRESQLNHPTGLQDRMIGKKSKIRKIVVQAPEVNILLVDFLSEVNYLRQIHMEMYESVKFEKFSDIPSTDLGQVELEAELEGYEAEEFGQDIKAVTFHDLALKQNPEGIWETCIVFDV